MLITSGELSFCGRSLGGGGFGGTRQLVHDGGDLVIHVAETFWDDGTHEIEIEKASSKQVDEFTFKQRVLTAFAGNKCDELGRNQRVL